MNNLLIDDYPILVLPTLATEIGLNEAIVLQQMHYWLKTSNHNYDGKRWIYNSYPKWIEQFPFWSESTIKRTITSLEKQELIFVGNYNKAGFDRTKWYSINYDTLDKSVTRASGQNDPTMRSKWTDGTGQNDPTNTRDYTETTTDSPRNQSNIYELISKEIQPITNSMQFEKLSYELDLLKDIEIAKVAIEYCKSKNKGIAYLTTILKNWNNEGVDTKEKALDKVKPKQQVKGTLLDDILNEE